MQEGSGDVRVKDIDGVCREGEVAVGREGAQCGAEDCD